MDTSIRHQTAQRQQAMIERVLRDDAPRAFAAVVVTLELHRAEQDTYADGSPVKGEYVCIECTQVAGEWKGWPCSTVASVYAALGVEAKPRGN